MAGREVSMSAVVIGFMLLLTTSIVFVPWLVIPFALLGSITMMILLDSYLYRRCGFTLLGAGAVLRGSLAWYFFVFGWSLLPSIPGLVLVSIGVILALSLLTSIALATNWTVAIASVPAVLLYCLVCALGGIIIFAGLALIQRVFGYPPRSERADACIHHPHD